MKYLFPLALALALTACDGKDEAKDTTPFKPSVTDEERVERRKARCEAGVTLSGGPLPAGMIAFCLEEFGILVGP